MPWKTERNRVSINGLIPAGIWKHHMGPTPSEKYNRSRESPKKRRQICKNKYKWDEGSVTEMIRSLCWTSLAHRRKELRLTLMFKIVKGLVQIPTENILIPSDSRTREHRMIINSGISVQEPAAIGLHSFRELYRNGMNSAEPLLHSLQLSP